MSVVYRKLEEVCEILDSQRVPITAKDRKSGIYPYYGANGLQDHVSDYIFDDELVLLAEDGGNFGSKDRPIAYRVSGKCWVNNHAHVLKAKSNIHIDYLCYALMFYNTDGLVNGATRQKLTQAAMRQMVIPYRCMKEQEQIVDEISRVFHLIAVRNEELALLEQLVKSRFIELFENTNHPRVALIDLIKEGAGLSYGIVQPGDDGTGDMGVLRPVDMVDGRISTASIKYINRSIGDGFRKTELTGDELLITVRGTTGITALTDSRFRGMNVTRGIAVIRYDRNKIDPVYLNAFLNTQESQRYIQEHTRGATLQQINLSDLRIQEIMLPPMDLQRQLAAFVEQIDKSKFEIQKSLEKLEILKKSIMQQYFG
jgi:type I restriction enzyme S subunit